MVEVKQSYDPHLLGSPAVVMDQFPRSRTGTRSSFKYANPISPSIISPFSLLNNLSQIPISPMAGFTPRHRQSTACTVEPGKLLNWNHTLIIDDEEREDLILYDDDDDDEDDDGYDDESESVSIGTMIRAMSSTEEELALMRRGYEYRKEICSTMQGKLILALNTKANNTKVAIKTCDLALHRQGIAVDDGINIVVDEDIVKEAGVLRHLTQQNDVIKQHVVQFVDLIQSDTDHLLVMEYVDHSMTLSDYIKTAHGLRDDGTINKKKLLKIMKDIIWQLCATIDWMHNEMHCAHLDLCPENIMTVINFEKSKNGVVVIDEDPLVKIVDFGCAEKFDADFHCDKFGTGINREQYLPPKMQNHREYDARAADVWLLGMTLYEALIGSKPFENIPIGAISPCMGPFHSPSSTVEEKEDSVSYESVVGVNVECQTPDTVYESMFDLEGTSGYWAIYSGKLREHMKKEGLTKYLDSKKNALTLLEGMLEIIEKKRWSAQRILKSKYFSAHYKTYSPEIIQRRKKNKQKQKNGKGNSGQCT